jgi:hypothetical protein
VLIGANYAQAFYWFVEEKAEDSIIQIDGNTIEIDLDNDDKKEIVANSYLKCSLSQTRQNYMYSINILL